MQLSPAHLPLLSFTLGWLLLLLHFVIFSVAHVQRAAALLGRRQLKQLEQLSVTA